MQGEIFYRLEGVDDGEEEPTDTRVLSEEFAPSNAFSRSSILTQVLHAHVDFEGCSVA